VTWTPIQKNCIQSIYQQQFNAFFKCQPKIEVCKGGLECGYIVSKIKNMQAIAIGPNIHEPHSINEYCELDSCDKVFSVLINTLSSIK
jgi:dipeptidase D